jgi:hypothetical protein
MRLAIVLALLLPVLLAGQEQHNHPAPEKLGTVSFPTSCRPEVQEGFNRAVALLHSFAYLDAEEGFRRVVEQDPHCAIAQWGSAMTHFHQLWDLPPSAADTTAAERELRQAATNLEVASERERAFIWALGLLFKDASTVPYSTRALNYEGAMHELAISKPQGC